jgi:hypothetical protein
VEQDKPLDFEAVLAAERGAGAPGEGRARGFALSGGGIRSATFNLGVIQALAELKLLQRFDYLSTISGGGYIGSWLSLFIKRYAGGDVAVAEDALMARDEHGLEHRAIRFLRAFSNYLTPRLGLSKDTLVAVATYARNLLLNLTILVTLLGALLLVPRIVALAAEHLRAWGPLDAWYDWIMIALFVAPTFVVALGLLYQPPAAGVHRPWFLRNWWLLGLIDAPVLAAALVTATYYVQLANSDYSPWPWIATVIGAYFLLWLIGVTLATIVLPEAKTEMRQLISRNKVGWHTKFVAFAALAGAIGGMILLGLASAIAALPGPHRLWVGVTLGPPAVIAAVMLIVVAHIGFMSRSFGEPERELWSVYGARLLLLLLCWITLFGVAFYGAAAIRWANDWIVGLGGAAWVLTTLFGVFSAASTTTGTREASKVANLLTRIAPYAFVLGLLLALSWGLHRALEHGQGPTASIATSGESRDAAAATAAIVLRAEPTVGAAVVTVRSEDEPGLWAQFAAAAAAEYGALRSWFEPVWMLPAMALAAFLAALLLSWRVNINVFSLHHFYRNRLTRCYLGATNGARRPHALTGFDPADDIALAELKGQKPLHIVGTAINLNRGRQLAWQNRRAASFTFTPLHAGYEPASAQVAGGFRPAGEYGKDADGQPFMLGTAVAISGAAASPNMGYHTSPAVAFLMTVFNVRLGHWCGDTRHDDAWQRRDPTLGLRYWCAELTGTADQDYPFVSLSDGGHFENLGVYELVRRRCALILASDAGADPMYAFEDLAGAMRKCYTDFGVEFDFGGSQVDEIRPVGDEPSTRHYAIATIKYPGGVAPGTLIYWKASLTADMPPDIMHYRRTRKDFPHESTADQFFDESQFESYRHLGYEVAMRSIKVMKDGGELPAGLG